MGITATPNDVLDIKSLDSAGLVAFLASLNHPAYRARQIERWLYAPEAGVSSFDEMTDLPLSLRNQLSETCSLSFPETVQRRISRDGSRTYLLRLADGAQVECVGIPSWVAPEDEDPWDAPTDKTPGESLGDNAAARPPRRLTVCFSTQVGCSMGCVFCATGHKRFTRSLIPGEIVDQLTVVSRDFNARVTNAVAMGQGEPFANYDATLAALRFINNPKLFGIGARHLTVSTCGIISSIRRFSQEPEQFTLAVSLHSALQPTRDLLLPRLKNQPLTKLRVALADYMKQTGRRPSLEYALISSINDSKKELDGLISFCKIDSLIFHVNLIPFNAIDQLTWKPSSPFEVREFAQGLRAAGIDANIRVSKGTDIAGACGQLSGGVT